MIETVDSKAPYVFLSYSSTDRARALRVADLLESHGVPVWIDRKSIAGGTSWGAEIVRGIRGAAALIVLCSEAAIRSKNVQQEVQLAWECDRPLLPLLLEAVQVPDAMRYALAGRQWIEILERPDDEWIGPAIHALVGAGLAVPSPTLVDPSSLPRSAMDHGLPTVPSAPPSNLPTPPTALVGREHDLAALAERFRPADARLVTLTGPGGIGKTRLAIQLAADTRGGYPDGVFFVSLASIADPALVPASIARAFNVPVSSGGAVLEDVKDFLRNRQALVVLDNLEHLLPAAPVIADILAAAPRLKVLVTSRARLQLRGEREFPVPPLGVPEPGHALSLDQIARCDAVRLFVERARDVRADFELVDANAGAVAEICQRLDGLPLAIELAAARIKVFPPAALLRRLENRLKVLTGGARDLPARQQTLRDTIAWSYDLLDASEQRLFRQLSVFRGGCTLEAAVAVCSLEGDPDGAEDEILAGLASLADKSLVREVELASGPGEVESRFRLGATIREFAAEQLEAKSEADNAARRHARYFVTLIEGVRGAWNAFGQLDKRRQLQREHDNLGAALRWAEEADPELGRRLADAFDWFAGILVSTYQGDAVASDYERLLARARQNGDKRGELRALVGLTEAYYVRALDDQTSTVAARARECYDAGLPLARALGDRMTEARLQLASVRFRDFWLDYGPQAELNGREAIRLSQELGDESLRIEVGLWGWFLLTQDRDKAEIWSRELVQLLTSRGDDARLNLHYFWLMWSYLQWGDLQRCIEIVEAATRLALRIGVPPVQYPTIKALALLNLGRFGEARAALDDEVADDAHPFGRAQRDSGMATFLYELRSFERAAALFRDVDDQARRVSRPWMQLSARAGLVNSLVHLDRIGEAKAIEMRVGYPSYFWPFQADSRVELALADGRADEAYGLAEEAATEGEKHKAWLAWARAREAMVRASLRLDRFDAAIAVADGALVIAQRRSFLPLVWRLRAGKAIASERLSRAADAAAEYARAANILRALANSIDDIELRQVFLTDRDVANVLAKAATT